VDKEFMVFPWQDTGSSSTYWCIEGT